MPNNPTIMYVEDDETLSYITKENLERNNYNVTCFKNGKEALNSFSPGIFDICLLDIMLPEADGFTVAENIRKQDRDIPIIFITAKSLKEDKIHGLIIGGDDYIVKPFSIEELILKIEIFLKRNKITRQSENNEIFTFGKFKLNFSHLLLESADKKIRLTYREAELLRFFCRNQNTMVTRETILNTLWKDNDYFMGRSMDVFISRLRKHLKSDSNVTIENVHGVGFIFKTKS